MRDEGEATHRRPPGALGRGRAAEDGLGLEAAGAHGAPAATRLGTRALPVLVFITCFALASFAIGIASRFMLPPKSAMALTGKLADLAARAADADTIAMGSSRVRHAFDPRAFDAAAAQAGCEMRSYNLSVGGLNLVEMRYLLRQLRLQNPGKLKRIILDPPNQIFVQFDNLRSRRIYVTTDPLALATAVADIASHPAPRKLGALARFAVAFLFHNSSVGAFTELLQAQEDTDPDQTPTILGFRVPEMNPPTPSRRAMLADARRFALSVESARQAAAEVGRSQPADSPLRRYVIDHLLDLIESFGYEPILLILPQAHDAAVADARMLELRSHESRPNMLVVNTMSAGYPVEVFTFDAWYDQTHVQPDVGRSISTHLGREVCRRTGRTSQTGLSTDAVR